MKMSLVTAACAAFLMAGTASAQAVYSNDFDGNVVTGAGVSVTSSNASGTGTATSGSWNASGWSGTFLRNDSVSPITTTEFSFSGLASHTQISLGGVLGMLDSWDSTNGNPAPDWLQVLVNGNVVAQLTATNASGNNTEYGGGTVIALHQNTDGQTAYSDTLVDFANSPWATFAHTGSTLTIAFRAAGAGWQGGSDESWGLDKFSVTALGATSPVPEPAAWGMMIGGFGLAGMAVRRRRVDVALA